jgi:hypothetical protein
LQERDRQTCQHFADAVQFARGKKHLVPLLKSHFNGQTQIAQMTQMGTLFPHTQQARLGFA